MATVQVLEEGTVIPGEKIELVGKNSKRKKVVHKDQNENPNEPKRRKEGPTKKELRLKQVAPTCSRDVQAVWNEISTRYGMFVRRVDKKKEGLEWEGFKTRFYTVPKMISFLHMVSGLFASEDWFGEELKMIAEKNYIDHKPQVPELSQ